MVVLEKERKVIFVDNNAFKRQVQKYGEKVDTERKIKEEVKKMLPKLRIDEPFLENTLENFYSALEKEFKGKNPMKIKGEKLCMLLDFDTSELISLASEYNSLKSLKSPSISNFTIYAETEKELKKLALCDYIIKGLESMNEDFGFRVSPMEAERIFRRIIIYSGKENKLVANWMWIKDKMY